MVRISGEWHVGGFESPSTCGTLRPHHDDVVPAVQTLVMNALGSGLWIIVVIALIYHCPGSLPVVIIGKGTRRLRSQLTTLVSGIEDLSISISLPRLVVCMK